MAIYKMVGDKQGLEPIHETSFSNENVKEVDDLQRLIVNQPDILEHGLLIIRAEFSEWQDSKRRIDLLALDRDGCLVVIELKRGDTGAHSELQAIRYAAMVSNLTFERVVDAYQIYYGLDEDESRARICEHLNIKDAEEAAISTEKPRIILACEDFSRELTTSVLWLNDFDLDIKCIRLKPYRMGESIIVESSQIIPLPEAADFIERFREQKREAKEQGSGKAKRTPGIDEFCKYIAKAQESFQPGLRRLLDSAIQLERRGLVEPVTFVNGRGHYIRLELRITGSSQYLVSFNNLLYQGGCGEISFWPHWEQIAPIGLERIGQLIGPVNSSSGVRHRKLSTASTLSQLDDILDAVCQAYREANGTLAGDEQTGA